MAFNPLYKMTIQDAGGRYYYATQNLDGIWNVSTTLVKTYLVTLPSGWGETAIAYERDMSYLGVFRSMSNGSFSFSKDARAIIAEIHATEGIKGFGTLTIWIINQNDFNYSIYYRSQLNFRTYHNHPQRHITEIGTLDSGLIKDFRAYGDTSYNRPIWQTDGSGGWITDANFVIHDGIKLLYNATYTSGAGDGSIYDCTGMMGFNDGRHDSVGSPDDGYHVLPIMVNYNITQNNGTTTFIGNDILANQLLQGNQSTGLNLFKAGSPPTSGGVCEENFAGTNNSKPYTRNNYSLKHLGIGCPQIEMFVSVSGKFSNGAIPAYHKGATTNAFLRFVLFEIDSQDNPKLDYSFSPPRYRYTTILNFDLTNAAGVHTIPNQGRFSNYQGGVIPNMLTGSGTLPASPTAITFNFDHVYVLGIIYDDPIGLNHSHAIDFGLEELQFSIFSKYDYGVSGVPIPAPRLNASVFPALRLNQLWESLVPYLATRRTDENGFPVPVVSPYYGVSDFLSNAALPPIGDIVPYQIMITSAYCVHNLQGFSYISMSCNQLFDFCKKQLGCGLGVEYDANGVATGLRIEDLKYFFNPSVMILDLGTDISNLELIQCGEDMGIAANLKLGYPKADTNSDFGVDPFITELYFNTPVSEVEGVMDFEAGEIVCEQYEIEKIRVQKVNQPVGSSFDPASPSTDNKAIGLYCRPTTTVILPMIDDPIYPQYNIVPYDPDNNPVACSAYQIVQYSGVTPPVGATLPAAQSNDPTAATAVYVNGLYYPDTAINLPFSPKRALKRCTGQLIHSYLDKMDTEYLTYRNTYVMQYNNRTLALSGMESNLNIGSGLSGVITEMKDELVGDLPTKLFLPIKAKFTSTSGRNLYSVLNSNPNGYIRFEAYKEGFGNIEYKMFLIKATQKATMDNNIATDFEGWLHPDMIIY